MDKLFKELKKFFGIGEKLCDKCEHWQYCSDYHNPCPDCEQYGGGYYCKCSDYAENVEECKHFKPLESEGAE